MKSISKETHPELTNKEIVEYNKQVMEHDARVMAYNTRVHQSNELAFIGMGSIFVSIFGIFIFGSIIQDWIKKSTDKNKLLQENKQLKLLAQSTQSEFAARVETLEEIVTH